MGSVYGTEGMKTCDSVWVRFSRVISLRTRVKSSEHFG